MAQSAKLTRAACETYNLSVPLHEFQCSKCGHRFERIQKFSDSDPKKCPKCGAGKLKRLLHAPAVRFKGSGWYATDYPNKGMAEAAKKERGDSESSAVPAKDAPAKEKTETKPKSEPKKKK